MHNALLSDGYKKLKGPQLYGMLRTAYIVNYSTVFRLGSWSCAVRPARVCN